jgi:PQQ-like domain
MPKKLKEETVKLDIYQANNLLDTLKEEYLEDLSMEIEQHRNELAKEIVASTMQIKKLQQTRDLIISSNKFKAANGAKIKLCDKARLARQLKSYENIFPLTDCETAILIVVIDVIFIFLGLFGIHSANQDRLVNSFLRATNKTTWSLLSLQIVRMKTASNFFWKGMAICSFLGALYKGTGLKFLVSYLWSQLTWWQAVKISAIMIAQLIAWLASEGLAFCAQLSLFAWHVEQTIEDAMKVSQTCVSKEENFWKTAATPSSDGSFIYFRGTDNRLWKISVKDGNPDHYFNQTIWHTKSSICIYDDYIYFQGTDDKLWKVNRVTGESDTKFCNKNWKCKSTPVVHENFIYFRGTDDRLWRADIFNGNNFENFNKDGKWKTKSSPVVDGNYIYFQDKADRLWKVSIINGEADTSFNNNGVWKSKSSPVVNKGFIYFQGTDDKLWKVKISTSTADDNFNKSGKWKSKSAPIVNSNYIYFQGTDNMLWKVDISNGAEVAEFNHSKVWRTNNTPFYTLDKIFFQGTDDRLWVINAKDSIIFEFSKYYYIPNGSFQNTAQNYRTVLKAKCKTSSGSYKDSELEISTLKLNDLIVNSNGTLKIVEGCGPATSSFIPEGKYKESSTDIMIEFSSLNQQLDSTYHYANYYIAKYSPTILTLDNINGKLVMGK